MNLFGHIRTLNLQEIENGVVILDDFLRFTRVFLFFFISQK